MYIKLPKSNLK